MITSTFGQEVLPAASLIPAASRRDDGESAVTGSQIFITLLLSLLGGAIGYAIGYERATSKVPRGGGGSYRATY